MRKFLFALLLVATVLHADDAIYFNTKTGAIKQSATGVGAVTKPYDFNAVSVIGIDTTTTFGNQLIEGGGVVWTGDLNFTVSSARFRINGIEYVSPQKNITLAAADADDDRIDVFALQGAGGTLGEAVAITGIPGGPPLEPQIDPVTQIRLTSVIIPEDATAPVITNEDIYLENTEWTTTTNSPTFLIASINNPHLGTKDVEGTNLASNNNVAFTRPSGTVALSDYTSLVFYVRSKGAWAATKGISISWLNGSTLVGTAVAFRNGTFGFDSSNTTTYQQIVIPAASFNTSTTVVNKLLMTVSGSGANIPGFYLDDVFLQSNIVNPPPGGGDFSTNVSLVTSGNFVQFTGTSGKLGTDGGLSRTIDGTFAANSDTLLPSQKAVKTYVDGVVGGGAPSTVDYLVGTASGGLSAEIVVGTSPGGELGGTWASPTIDDGVTVTGWNLGASTATTPTGGDNDTSLATTAFVQSAISGFGNGTVTNFSAGDLSPLFTTSEATTTTTPALTFTLSNAAAHSYFGNNTGSSGAPAFHVIDYSELGGTPTIPVISDTAYDATSWDANLDGATKNAIRDKFESLAGTIPTISDTAFAASWNGVTTIAPSKNAVYDEIHLFDTADNGTILDAGTGFRIGGAAASRKMLVGNGTNFIASTETWAVPGTSGNVLKSDGTNWTSGAITSGQVPDLGGNPTVNVGLSAVNGSATTYLRSDGAPALSQSIAPAWTGQHTFSEARTIASGTSAILDDVNVSAQTTTVTGTTQIATAKGFNKISIYSPTYTDASSVVIDRGASLYIENAPLAAGSVTLSLPYALWVDDGAVRFDGGLTVGGTAAPSTGVINANTGFTISGNAVSGRILRGDGTNFINSACTFSDTPGTAGNILTSDGTNWIAAAPSGASFISDTAFASSWNTVTTIAPSKNAVYDELHLFDTDDDGKVDVLDAVSSAGFLAVTSGGVPVEGRTLTEGLAIDITNPTGAAGAPTFAFDPTELTGSRTWGDASTDTIVWTFDRATGTDSTITSLSGGIGVQSLTDAALTSGRVTFAGASGILTDDADLTFATDTLTATNAKVTTPTNVATSVLTTDGTQTLTNKRVNPRALDSNAPSSPVAPDSDSYDFVVYRGISAALTINAPTGTPVSGQKLIIRFKDDGTARALTWQTGSSGQFRASTDLALPTTTVLSKTLYCGFIYNATDSRWDLLALLNNF